MVEWIWVLVAFAAGLWLRPVLDVAVLLVHNARQKGKTPER